MKSQLAAMLAMQHRMNQRVHPDWIAQEFAWYRALWLECGELVDHFGYKWWKKQLPDLEQVRLEVVDIWHFGMSMLLDGRSPDDIAAGLLAALPADIPSMTVLDAAEALASRALAERRFDVVSFFSLMHAAGMGFADLYEAYIGKNVLNFFRQDHGYQDGSYHKIWSGREDNEHLLEILAGLDSRDEDFSNRVYQALAARYAAIPERRGDARPLQPR